MIFSRKMQSRHFVGTLLLTLQLDCLSGNLVAKWLFKRWLVALYLSIARSKSYEMALVKNTRVLQLIFTRKFTHSNLLVPKKYFLQINAQKWFHRIDIFKHVQRHTYFTPVNDSQDRLLAMSVYETLKPLLSSCKIPSPKYSNLYNVTDINCTLYVL